MHKKGFVYFLLAALCLCQGLQAADSPKLHICTAASHETKGLQILRKSCERNNLELHVEGLGNPFPGLSYKLHACEEYAKTLPPKDIVMFVDAYDVFFQAGEKEILDLFFAMNHPFVLSVERYCYPFPQVARLFPAPTSFRYINSGSYMGYVDKVIEILNSVRPYEFWWDDQGILTLDYIKEPEKYCLDSYCQLFMPLAGCFMDDLLIDEEKGLIHCRETGTIPCIIHGNGSGRGLYNKLCEKFYSEILAQ